MEHSRIYKFELGDRVRDTISDFTGIITTRSEWHNGCIRYMITPEGLHEGRPIAAEAFDEAQLVLVDKSAKLPERATIPSETPRLRTGGPPLRPGRRPD